MQRALETLERAELIEMRRGRIHVLDVDALEGWTDGVMSDSFKNAVTVRGTIGG